MTITGTNQTSGFLFENGGGVENVTFDTFSTAVSANGAGTFTMSGVHFKNVSSPVIIAGSLTATIDASGTEPFAIPPASGFGFAAVGVDGTADVTFTGNAFRNIAVANGPMFLARGNGKLTIDGTVFDTLVSRPLTINDDADVVLKGVQIHNVSWPSPGAGAAAIAMGGQNTLAPLDPSLDIQNSDISSNQVNAIVLTLYAGMASKPIIELTDSHVNGNTGNGIWITTPGTVDAALVATVQATNTNFRGNTGTGILAETAAVTVTQGDISMNGADGVALTGATFKNSLQVRSGTILDQNGGHGFSFAGAATSTLDLGKKADPGNTTFTGVAVGHSAVNLTAAIQGFAVGNTWVPNVQGANATGLFTTPTTLAAGSSGLNATVATGASLVVAQ